MDELIKASKAINSNGKDFFVFSFYNDCFEQMILFLNKKDMTKGFVIGDETDWELLEVYYNMCDSRFYAREDFILNNTWENLFIAIIQSLITNWNSQRS